MNYRVDYDLSMKAKSMIENDELSERLNNLINQLKKLNTKESCFKVSLCNEEYENMKSSLNKLEDSISVLNFKKDQLEVSLNKFMEKINIAETLRVKEDIKAINNEIDKINVEKGNLNGKLRESEIDYENQMIKIREKYCDVDIIKNEINDSDFSPNVISNFKREYSTKLVNQFLNSVPEDKQKEILNNNQDLKGYLDVGENI